MIACSTALAFVLEATKYIGASGSIVAILPAGVFRNEKDRWAWTILHSLFEVTLHGRYGRDAFQGSFVRTSVVRLQKLEVPLQLGGLGPSLEMVRNGRESVAVGVVRGSLQMHKASFSGNGKGVPLVHTTDLGQGRFKGGLRRVNNYGWTVRGPAVLLPRVGEPREDKIVTLASGTHVALSDCVIGLVCEGEEDSAEVKKRLLGEWPRLAECYTGTCARFITLRTLQLLLEEMGVRCNFGEARKVRQSSALKPPPREPNMKR